MVAPEQSVLGPYLGQLTRQSGSGQETDPPPGRPTFLAESRDWSGEKPLRLLHPSLSDLHPSPRRHLNLSRHHGDVHNPSSRTLATSGAPSSQDGRSRRPGESARTPASLPSPAISQSVSRSQSWCQTATSAFCPLTLARKAAGPDGRSEKGASIGKYLSAHVQYGNRANHSPNRHWQIQIESVSGKICPN